MKILHSADWHLDSPIIGRSDEQTQKLKNALLEVPHKVAAAARTEGCDLMLLSGDLFDGPHSPESMKSVLDALEEVAIPVFIAPGNHDFSAPWHTASWPKNVHVFTSPTIESVSLPQLDCRIYGAAFTRPDSDPLLDGFTAEQSETFALGVLHGDPTQATSPYNSITAEQIRNSGLDYLALGHIHKSGQLTAGKTLCAWPGCPMGRGFDELDSKGVFIVSLDQNGCQNRYLALDTPRFYDLQCEVNGDAKAAIAQLLPAVGNQDFYRITLTGESDPIDTALLENQFSDFPNLQLRDRTELPMDLWASVGEDTLEGVFFQLLQQQLENADNETREQILLAAKISRQILENREVKLP